MKWKSLVLPLAVFLLGGLLGFAMQPRIEPPAPPMPTVKYIEVEKVKEIEVPGPERVVERVEWRTKTVEVPKEVLKVIERGVQAGSLEARVEVDADKYEGTEGDRLVRGWFGFARCEVRPDEQTPWVALIDEPFQLESSTAITTDPLPIQTALSKYRLSGGFGLSTNGGVGMVGFEKRLPQPSNRFLKAVKPDWAGVQGFATPSDSGFLGTVAWEF